MSKYHHCYLLRSLSPSHKYSTYIGYTVHPKRRIRQHNGEIKNGAWRTKKRRPWKMICLVYGFIDKISALQFEWAFQHPMKSRNVKTFITAKLGRGRTPKAKFELLCKMLTLDPWKNHPLKLHMFEEDLTGLLHSFAPIPNHMSVASGDDMDLLEVYSIAKGNINMTNDDLDDDEEDGEEEISNAGDDYCTLCTDKFKEPHRYIECNECSIRCHLSCLASHFIDPRTADLIPSNGECPSCNNNLIWTELILTMKTRKNSANAKDVRIRIQQEKKQRKKQKTAKRKRSTTNSTTSVTEGTTTSTSSMIHNNNTSDFNDIDISSSSSNNDADDNASKRRKRKKKKFDLSFCDESNIDKMDHVKDSLDLSISSNDSRGFNHVSNNKKIANITDDVDDEINDLMIIEERKSNSKYTEDGTDSDDDDDMLLPLSARIQLKYNYNTLSRK